MTMTLRERLADLLFERELDRSFYEGHKEGGSNTIDVIVFALETSKIKMSPQRREGFEVAVEIMRDIKKEIK
jgi:hypothetical protein